MTDIRKHGFESDAQWREYQQEIEEATSYSRSRLSNEQSLVDDLALLRADVTALREQIWARRSGDRMTRWQRVGGAVALLLIAALAAR
ncbi:hypothetical protein MUO32_29035 [Shinella sp. CPCC 101442]|uniref:hypothetical protein n=1 Tax=Shinella sp. CPCC 101442 TaxID=2932265 RepID=UPI0021535B88|nr:hypothetical protein [Shinella sp. CPCC 101442]MCR6503067.1 hypothetical protein [Shinella sp. CPCC 101442]